MPTPLRRDRELSEDQDVNIDEEDDDSLAGKSQTISLILFIVSFKKFASCLVNWRDSRELSPVFFFLLLIVISQTIEICHVFMFKSMHISSFGNSELLFVVELRLSDPLHVKSRG